jgi:YegS/Rv2252/BmrU family lipid kinase
MSKENKHIAIVCNPQAGNGKALLVADRIAVVLKEKKIPYSLFTTYWPQVWSEMTEAWIIGGDGTLNYFINQYPEINIPLSIFEGGTGNDFQELLYGNISIEQQIEKILNAAAHLVDAGMCNQKLFLNGVGIGFDGAIVKDLRNKTKKPGKASYLAAVLKNIFIYKGIDHLIKFNGQTISEKLLMINIANGKTEGGGFRVTPSAVIDDGKLDINIVKEIGSLKRLFYLSVIEKGKHLHLPLIQYHQTEEIKISTSVKMPAHMDGEYFETNSFVIECLPKRFSFLW